MYIRLVHFRGHADSEYQLNQGKVILIKGPSGAGKSTVFEAIYFCLFGGMRFIKPRVQSSGRTGVIIEVDNLVIERYCDPVLLQITLVTPDEQSRQYQDAEAQNIINRRFGTKDIWKACSYISQGERCTLLYGSNKDKMDLLNKLSFSGENPKEVIAKIDNHIRSFTEYYKRIQIEHETETRMYNTKIAVRPVTINVLLTVEQITSLTNQIAHDEAQVITLTNRVLDQQRLQGIYTATTNTINSLTTTLATLPVVTTDDIDKQNTLVKSLEDSMIAFQQMKAQQTQYNRLNSELTNIVESMQSLTVANPIINFDVMPTVDNNQILFVQESETTTNHGQKLAQSLNIDYNQTVIDNEKVRVQSIINSQPLLSNYSRLNNELTNVNNSMKQITDANPTIDFSTIPTVDNNDILRVQAIEMVVYNGTKMAESINIVYDQNMVSAEIQRIQSLLDRQPHLANFRRLKQTLTQINNELQQLSIGPETYVSESDIVDSSNRYQTLSKSLDVLQCPHCTGSLRYDGSSLQKSDHSFVSHEDINAAKLAHEQLLQRRELSKRYDQLQQQKESVMSQLNDLVTTTAITDSSTISTDSNIAIKLLSDTELAQYKQHLTILNNIKFPEQPIEPDAHTSLQLQQIKQWQDLNKQQLSLTTQLQQLTIPDDGHTLLSDSEQYEYKMRLNSLNNIKFPAVPLVPGAPTSDQLKSIKLWQELNGRKTEISGQLATMVVPDLQLTSDVVNELTEARRQQQQIQQQLSQRVMIEQQLAQSKSTLSTIVLEPHLKGELDQLQEQVTANKRRLDEAQYAQEVYDMYASISNKGQQVIAAGQELKDIHKLRSTAVDVECRKLEQVIDSINTAMNDVLAYIFDDPITVNILLYRELKSKKNQFKQQINVSINYNGSQCDNINQMSGGEGDRISFALIFALNQISGSPVLLLDESMASLDGELRTKAIHALKECMCNTKTIALIDHEGTEGIFDEVISF